MDILNKEYLENFINHFYGYGNYKAPFWFIGIEEGGGELEDVKKKIRLLNVRENELEDLRDFHLKIDSKYVAENGQPYLQRTWSRIIRIRLGLDKLAFSNDEIKEHQNHKLARKTGKPDSCLLELMPLPARRNDDWQYGEWSSVSYLKSREKYRNEIRPKRIKHLKEKIKHFKPKIVVFYGIGHYKYWEEISCTSFEKVEQLRLHKGKNSDTLFFITDHLTARGTTNDQFDKIGQFIKKQLH